MPDRRATDIITDDMVNEIANNGHSEKQLIARMHLENKVDHKEIYTKINFCNKFVWIIITVFAVGFIGGTITIIVELARHLAGG